MPTVIRFGSHSLEPRSGILRYEGKRCPLQFRPTQLLTFLIERADEIVSREDIRERLWSDTVVTYDQNINYAIRRIRVALGSDAHMVQTVPRQGYRFVGRLTVEATPRFSVSRRALAFAAVVWLAMAVGFGAGIVMRDRPNGQFVYDHLVHPDRCPYIRMFLPTHHNS